MNKIFEASLWLFLLTTCFSPTLTEDALDSESKTLSQAKNPLNILVFGGNGFVGGATVEKLSLLPDGVNLYLVNRGNSYWDFEALLKPLVKQTFVCDRSEKLSDCESLKQFVKDRSVYFDFVIDFTALEARHIEEAAHLLRSTYVGFYIYISSDSVYEVVVKKDPSSPSKESDAVRPEDEEQSQKLISRDRYGDGKLQGEEALARIRVAGGPPYVALRLPDIIGPRDNTNRFWMTHILLNVHTFLAKPIAVPSEKFQLSFVYSNDVASLIYDLVTSDDLTPYYDQSYNIAWQRSVSFSELYSAIAASSPIGKPFNLEIDDGAKAPHFFPSVTQGPVNTSKAMSELRWTPTDWTTAIHETVQFYKESSSKFPDQFRRALRGLNGRLDDKTLKTAAAGVYAVELSSGGCIDLHPNCGLWATTGECDRNPDWMRPNCMESCQTCRLMDQFIQEKESQKKEEL